MSLTSFTFLLFFTAVLFLYYLVPGRLQWILLLAASYAFYLICGIGQVFFLLGTTFVTYVAAILMQKIRNRSKAELEAGKDLTKEEKQLLKKQAKNNIFRIQVILFLLNQKKKILNQ